MVRAWSILYRQTYLFFKRHMTEATAINGTDQIIALYVGDHPGVNQDNISSYFMINKTTVTKALDRLEKTGYITRSVRPQNRRENAINLTPYGEQAATSIREMLAHWRNAVTAGFSKEELMVFEQLCERAASQACALNEFEMHE